MLNTSLWHPYEKVIELSRKGKNLEAIKKINDKLQQVDLKQEAIKRGMFWKISCYNYMGNFSQGLTLAERLLALLQQDENPDKYWQFDAQMLLIWSYYGLGRVNEGLKALKGIKKLYETLNDSRPKQPYRQSKLLILEGSLLKEVGDFNKALPLYKKSLAVSIDLDYLENSTLALCNIGEIYLRKGYLDKALRNFEKSKKLAKRHNLVINLLKTKINLGLTYYKKGELYTALNLFEDCLNKARQYHNKKLEGTILGHLGNIARKKGELKQAHELLNNSLAINSELNHELEITNSYMDLANFYMEKNDKYHVKQYLNRAKKLAQRNNYKRLLGWILYDLIRLLSDQLSEETNRQHLDQLNKLRQEQPDNKVFRQIFIIAKGILLKKGRLHERSQAQRIFSEISNEKIVDHEITICALINLVEILFTELKLLSTEQDQTYTETIIEELHSISNKLISIAEQQNSYILFTKTYLLQAKISLIQSDFDQARYLLNKAQNIAEEKGLLRLAQLVSYEHDTLIKNMNQWMDAQKQQKKTDSKISFWLKEEELTATLEKFIQNNFNILPQDENPTFLIITSKNGLAIYNRKFQANTSVKSHLLGGFLSAINSLGRTILSPDTINDHYANYRLRHGSHTIVVRPKNNLLFAYAFKGQSYGAIKKLELFIENIISLDNIWNVLQHYGGHLPEPERETLNDISSSIFLNPNPHNTSLQDSLDVNKIHP